MLLDIITKCAELREHTIDVKFFWVKGHVGITPNGKADALAKASVTDEQYRIVSYTKQKLYCILKIIS